MSYLLSKFITVFFIFIQLGQLSANVDVHDQEQINPIYFFEQVLSALDTQLEDDNMTEELYTIVLEDGISRLLVISNPERKTFKLGFLQLTSRVILGFDKNFPEDWRDQIDRIIEQKEIKGVFSSSGTFNGKTIFELFGY